MSWPGSCTQISLAVCWHSWCLHASFFCKATRFSPQTSSALETVYKNLPNIFLLFHFLMTEDNRSLKHSIRPFKKNCSRLHKKASKHAEQH